MLDTIFTSLPELSLIRTVIRIFAAIIAGGFISLSYIHSDKRQKYSSNFAMTVVILPAIVSVVITLIGSDLAKAISLGGVFALVRFRSVPGDSRDIAYVFFAMVVGLAIGMDCYAIAFALTAVVALAFTLLQKMNYAKNKNASEILKITVPEDLNFKDAFTDLFNEYLDKYTISSIRTTNMGTLYQITYDVIPKEGIDEKAFIDALRVKNGNLNIILGKHEETAELMPL
ncbi:MAG: DUF4956 domain-containing protein [Treponema porcinum]|uniref:DUF4956 domain-containing protein n=1 Tax=Treponema porcinum TaxID=261392 RepID=UPI002352726B|nr:DUF4956 domain-containing protein [Treponema porcinum]MCI7533417.1 DUF4956 domain-containing protein [Treponema porcinum]